MCRAFSINEIRSFIHYAKSNAFFIASIPLRQASDDHYRVHGERIS